MYLKSVLKCNSFDVTIGIKIPFFRVSVTVEPGRSLLQFANHELFENATVLPMITIKFLYKSVSSLL